MKFDKKSFVTLFAGVALFSSVGLNAAADSTNNSVAPDKGSVGGYFDDKGHANADLGSNNGDKSVSAQSDAHISIVNGYLVLETVPSLGFQDISGQQGDTLSKSVKDNNTVLRSDSFYGNNVNPNPTDLYVQDSRSQDKTGGYSVTAQLSPFGTYSNGSFSKLADSNQAGGFSLNLNGTLEKDSTNVGNPQASSNVNLPSDGKTTSTVLTNSAQGSHNTKANFNSSTLTVPEGISAGSYAAPINWTLTPTATATNANSGGNAH